MSSHLSTSSPGPADGEPVTFSRLFEEFLAISHARGRSPTTLHGYRAAIDGFWLSVEA